MKQIILSTFIGVSSLAQGATFFDQISAPNRNNYTGTVGTFFTVGASNLNVTHLGFQDAGLIGGLLSSHDVGIWDNSGTLIASVTVQAGTASTLTDNWRYEALAGPVTLTAGASYTIGSTVTSGGDSWSDTSNSASVTSSPSISVNDNLHVGGATLARPTIDGSLNTHRWAPANATFTAVASVPEPSSTALLGLGGLALLLRRKK